jgi:Glucose-6-phosphate dehydrogenase, NAD binding domain
MSGATDIRPAGGHRRRRLHRPGRASERAHCGACSAVGEQGGQAGRLRDHSDRDPCHGPGQIAPKVPCHSPLKVTPTRKRKMHQRCPRSSRTRQSPQPPRSVCLEVGSNDLRLSRRSRVLGSTSRPDNHVIVLFEATGDQARRKLLPGLFHLAAAGLMPGRYQIIGSSRRDLTDEQFGELARQAIAGFGTSKPVGQAWEAFRRRLSFASAAPGRTVCLVAAIEQAEQHSSPPDSQIPVATRNLNLDLARSPATQLWTSQPSPGSDIRS